ncbi:MAG: inner membrane CreD family protein, partial [Bacteroidia bacterium]
MKREKSSLPERINNWAKHSVMLKFFTIGILILILLIPSGMVNSLIRERQTLRDDAEAEISSKWGGEQTLGGVVLSVPYDLVVKNENGMETKQTAYAHFLPDELSIEGNLSPEKRYRGIYVVMLY